MTERTRASWLVYVLGALCAGAIVAAILVVGPASGSQTSVSRTVTVASGVVQSTVSGSGNLQAASQLNLGFKTSGTVTHIYVTQGEQVAQGQLLADARPAERRSDARTGQGHPAVRRSQPRQGGRNQRRNLDRTELRRLGRRRPGTTQPRAPPRRPRWAAGPPGDRDHRHGHHRGEHAARPRRPPRPPTDHAADRAPRRPAPRRARATTTTPTSTTPSKSTTTTPTSTHAEQEHDHHARNQETSSSSSSSSSSVSPATREANLASARAAVKSDKLTVQSDEQAVQDTKLYAPEDGTIVSLSGQVGEIVSGSGTTKASSASSSSSGSGSSAAGAAGASSSARPLRRRLIELVRLLLLGSSLLRLLELRVRGPERPQLDAARGAAERIGNRQRQGSVRSPR